MRDGRDLINGDVRILITLTVEAVSQGTPASRFAFAQSEILSFVHRCVADDQPRRRDAIKAGRPKLMALDLFCFLLDRVQFAEPHLLYLSGKGGFKKKVLKEREKQQRR